MLHFKTISDLRKGAGFAPPEHPQLSLLTGLRTCPLQGQKFTMDCYMISLKRLIGGVMLYGRTPYDHHNGCLSFIKPRQVLQFNDLELVEDGFMICVHEDFFNAHPLQNQLRNYHFFEYEIDEALHLSPREEAVIWELYRKIETEYNTNQDEYSRDIMLTHLDSILKYSQRYYKRQFINRAEASGKTISRFNRILSAYISGGSLFSKGLPTVNQLADELNLSPRYLSDLLKQETGKTAIELIHITMIAEAKNRLRSEDRNVSEIAFALGFENLSYFSKLFKREVGVSPNVYRKQFLN
ncbi:helix-turn-helix transcriptional regulator [Dyadobacter sp. UP-52]|uniref:Helix-turn-helix transcriptional regulator n=2 Tax=Dyadobacter subterraneus TaxID=2773304 RepID=A0ABR9W874_9BACT|nr:helix-turn-helix transcriptional regulator [Dyadobacter subterraneus]